MATLFNSLYDTETSMDNLAVSPAPRHGLAAISFGTFCRHGIATYVCRTCIPSIILILFMYDMYFAVIVI